MGALGREFSFDSAERRIRCAPHCLNLVVKSMLYGSKKDNIAQLLDAWGDADFDDEDEEERVNSTVDEITMESDPLDDEVDESEEDIPSCLTPEVITAEGLGKYRKNGPLGKLHNIGVAIRQSSQLSEALLRAQVSQNPAGAKQKVESIVGQGWVIIEPSLTHSRANLEPHFSSHIFTGY